MPFEVQAKFNKLSFCTLPTQFVARGIRTRALKTRALKDTSPKNTILKGHES